MEHENGFLNVLELTVRYGALEAVSEVSMSIPEGEIASLLGSNGSGKSTVLKAISGQKPPASGEIWFEGARLNGMPVAKILKKGISLVPEGRRLFPRMTVMENLEMGAYTRKSRAEINEDVERVLKHFPVLKEKLKQKSGTLSGGQQEMVAISRALMSNPKMLLMDEPAQGLAPVVVRELEEIIRELNSSGITVLMVEHNIRLAVGLAHKIFILETGHLVFEGTPEDLTHDDYVRRVYLGG